MDPEDFLETTLEVTIASDRETLVHRETVRGTGTALLIVLAGSRVGQRVQLGEDECVIGRGASAGLQLEGDAISRAHARVQFHSGDHYLIDCGSTNGSFVNYVKVTEKRLQDGDEIQIGHVLLKYLSGDNIETAYHEEFRRLVRHDALTGALNRPSFDEELRVCVRRSLAEGSSRSDSNSPAESGAPAGDRALSLVMFDLDHFKQINDDHGHTAGDLVLREVGAAVSALVLAPHFFARIGGEEFGIIFRGALSDARDLAETVRQAIAELLVVYEGTTVPVTASAGVAQLGIEPGQGGADRDELLTPSGLYEAADKRLYIAKHEGRNRVC